MMTTLNTGLDHWVPVALNNMTAGQVVQVVEERVHLPCKNLKQVGSEETVERRELYSQLAIQESTQCLEELRGVMHTEMIHSRAWMTSMMKRETGEVAADTNMKKQMRVALLVQT
jgi:hypothetical protein